MANENFIEHNFNLPTHANELSKAEEVIEKIRTKLTILEKNNCIDDKSHGKLYEETIRVLEYLGELSKPFFAINDELEDLYCLKYPHSSELAKKLWLDHNDRMHHPYNLLKNRCFRMLEELDVEYQRKFDKNPPNWNI